MTFISQEKKRKLWFYLRPEMIFFRLYIWCALLSTQMGRTVHLCLQTKTGDAEVILS